VTERLDWSRFRVCEAQVETHILNEDFLAALDVLVRCYQDVLTSFCTKLLASLGRAGADDAAQEIFLAVYQAMPRFRREASIRTWFFAIARKHCYQVLRNYVRQQRRQGSYRAAQEGIRTLEEFEEEDMDAQALDRLRASLSRLSKRERELLTLRYIEGHSVADLARHYFVAERTVYDRLKLARKHLVALYEKGSNSRQELL
jgi:RNA polymerase sigma-70 factor, ECF subfamily